jgi:uncharacterized protein
MLTRAILTGTILNALGIVIGGLMGLMLKRQFSASTQLAWRGLTGVITVFIGLRITWLGLNGTFAQVLRQFAIMLLAMTLGKLLGRLLHIQSSFNRLGQFASRRFAQMRANDPNRFNEGFLVCTLLFCAGPLGPIGSVQAGLMERWEPLAIKMVMDGLAAMGFVGIFGWGVMLSALPVFVFQGTLTLAVSRLAPFLAEHQLTDSVNAVSGLLIFCVSLIVLELKKVELADYLPSLVVAPLIAWLWR